MNANIESSWKSKIKELGLVETTTKGQTKRGTRQFTDPQTKTRYASYASGYVRRIHEGRTHHYPVNKRRKVIDLENEVTYVLLRKQANRMNLMCKAVETYRVSERMTVIHSKFPELSTRCVRELALKNYAYFSK